MSASFALAAIAVTTSSVSAAGWGTVKGRFVYKGTAKPEKITPTKDVEFCGKHDLVDETVAVGKEGGLQNVFVYLYTARGKKVDVHESYAAGSEAKVLDNKGCRFEPHAMTLWTEQPLEIRNSDEGVGHNTNGQLLVQNPKFNEQVTSGSPITKKFSKSEPIPTKVACNVHPWMSAFVLIRDNPYMAVSGEDGSFVIENVPAGKQDFVFWHEAKGNLKDLAVGKGKADRKGQVSLEVKDGETLDLGEIAVTSAVLGK
ncbi:MAG: hypothetical protein DCC67_04210 [Planctomycetota bacterium]|nr:MAG: hypothetical protein DCC67_04210 [Planctomycetota bacterium]